jgi:multidrug efflux pump
LARRTHHGYARALTWVLERRWLMVLVWLLVAALGGVFFSQLRSELAPTEDRGVISAGCRRRPLDGRLHLRAAARGERYYDTIPEAAAYNAVAGFPRWTTATRSCA